MQVVSHSFLTLTKDITREEKLVWKRGTEEILFCSFDVHLALWELNFSNVHLYFGVIPSFDYFMFNPLTPKSDQHLISPYNIASESKKITRLKKMSPTKKPLDC